MVQPIVTVPQILQPILTKVAQILNYQLSKWHDGTLARLQHLYASLAEGRKTCGRTPAITHFLYQMVAQQTARLTAHGSIACQSKAAHHVLAGEGLRQSGKGLVGL